MFISTDDGANWTSANNGLEIPSSSPYRVPASVYSFAAIGKNVYLAASGGVYVSTNDGSNWSSILTGNVYAVGAVGQVLLATYADHDSIFRSTDAGQTWTTLATGVSGHSLHCFSTMGEIIFAGGNGVLSSNDLGETWVEADNGMLSPDIRSFESYDSVLFAASYGQGVYQSWDKGETWASINAGLGSLYVQALIQEQPTFTSAPPMLKCGVDRCRTCCRHRRRRSEALGRAFGLSDNCPDPFNATKHTASPTSSPFLPFPPSPSAPPRTTPARLCFSSYSP